MLLVRCGVVNLSGCGLLWMWLLADEAAQACALE